EPVNEILRMMGDLMRYSEIVAGTPKTTFSTPGGRPASWNARAISSVVAGVSSAGLMMIEQPAPSAPAILRAGVIAGKFHGVNAATGPTGSGITMLRTPGTRPGMIRPYARRP